MTLRTLRERAVQVTALEIGGILLAAPVYRAIFGGTAPDSYLLLAALSAGIMIFSPVYNWGFDSIEWHTVRRLASNRPQRWRILHALGHELGSMIVTLPLIMWLTGHALATAVAVDIGLSAFYTAYVWLFFMAYDRLRPVRIA